MDKVLIYKYLKDSIKEKIDELGNSIRQVEESRNMETKSSVGDKYETGRAMAQNEMDRLNQQMVILREQNNLLNLLNPEISNQVVALGSLIDTNKGTFYIAIGFGLVQVEGKAIFCISPGSPLGREMVNKEVGDEVVFNGKAYKILNIE